MSSFRGVNCCTVVEKARQADRCLAELARAQWSLGRRRQLDAFRRRRGGPSAVMGQSQRRLRAREGWRAA